MLARSRDARRSGARCALRDRRETLRSVRPRRAPSARRCVMWPIRFPRSGVWRRTSYDSSSSLPMSCSIAPAMTAVGVGARRQAATTLTDFRQLQDVFQQPAAVGVVHGERRRPDPQPRCLRRHASRRAAAGPHGFVDARDNCPQLLPHLVDRPRRRQDAVLLAETRRVDPARCSPAGSSRCTSSSRWLCRLPRPCTRTNSPASNSSRSRSTSSRIRPRDRSRTRPAGRRAGTAPPCRFAPDLFARAQEERPAGGTVLEMGDVVR